jgi:hypothetical protein
MAIFDLAEEKISSPPQFCGSKAVSANLSKTVSPCYATFRKLWQA